MKRFGLLFWDWLVKLQRFFMIVTAIAVVFLVFGPLVMREIGIPFPGYEEFLLTFAFWMYMLGSSHGSFEKSQITADIMSRLLKGRKRQIQQVVASVLTFILGIILTYWALSLVLWSAHTGASSSVYKIPIVVGQASILVGLVISSFYHIVYMIKDIQVLFLQPRTSVAHEAE